VLGKFLAKFPVVLGFVGHDARFLGHVLANDRHDVSAIGFLDNEAAHLSAALDKRENSIFVMVSALLRSAFLATDEGLISFDNAAIAAHRGKTASAHGLTNAMAHEPCRFQRDAKRPVKLVGTDALLRRSHEINCL
jgi:hypothetical protein